MGWRLLIFIGNNLQELVDQNVEIGTYEESSSTCFLGMALSCPRNPIWPSRQIHSCSTPITWTAVFKVSKLFYLCLILTFAPFILVPLFFKPVKNNHVLTTISHDGNHLFNFWLGKTAQCSWFMPVFQLQTNCAAPAASSILCNHCNLHHS